jgi:hypothetical protein
MERLQGRDVERNEAMIDLILKILALAVLVFVWGFAWTWAANREEAKATRNITEKGMK